MVPSTLMFALSKLFEPFLADLVLLGALEAIFVDFCARLMKVYDDIQNNKHKQKSGLRKARTQFKIPRIKRNKKFLTNIILSCIGQEKLRKLMRRTTREQICLNDKYMSDNWRFGFAENALASNM